MDIGDIKMQEKKVIDSKVALIDSEGVIHAMGNSNEAGSHAIYFIDYIKENYSGIDVSKLNIGSERHEFGYMFGKLGDIIYFNDVNTGMIYLPDALTDEQIDALYKIDLGNQKIALFYNPIDFGSFKSFSSIGLDEQSTLKNVLDEYFGGEKDKTPSR